MYLGDFAEDATLYFLWGTNDSDGASITRATDGTVSVYKNDGVGQSVAGVTDTEDFDGLTGVHLCKIDLSSDVFYGTGNDYTVVLSAAVIDGSAVNAVLAHFSIENRHVGERTIAGSVHTLDDLITELAADHGAGAWITADLVGLLTDLAAAHGAGSWLTAVLAEERPHIQDGSYTIENRSDDA